MSRITDDEVARLNRIIYDSYRDQQGAAQKDWEMLEQLRSEVVRLKELLPKAWDAGAARTIASHKDFKQIYPTKEEWIKDALNGKV